MNVTKWWLNDADEHLCQRSPGISCRDDRSSPSHLPLSMQQYALSLLAIRDGLKSPWSCFGNYRTILSIWKSLDHSTVRKKKSNMTKASRSWHVHNLVQYSQIFSTMLIHQSTRSTTWLQHIIKWHFRRETSALRTIPTIPQTTISQLTIFRPTTISHLALSQPTAISYHSRVLYATHNINIKYIKIL